jgi:hypothetical protein
MSLGRNEPCLCGSGKKYKHCCLNAAKAVMDSPEMLTWRRVRRAIDGLPNTMLRFTTEAFGPAAVNEAWEEFVLDTDEEYTKFDPKTPHIQLFMPWFFHCWSPEGEEVEGSAMTPTRAFLEEKGSRLDPLARRYLEACLEAPFSFHEIVSSNPGRDFSTRDIITGEEHQVFEQSASRSMHVGDILYGQLVRVEAIAMLEACAPCPIPPIRKIELIDLRRSALRHIKLSGTALLWELDCELRELYFIMADDVLNPHMPQLQNTDGDPLELQRLVFDIDSPQVAFDALAHLAFQTTHAELLEDATLDADGALMVVQFGWAKAGNSKHAEWTNTILGHIKIDGTRLVAQVNSAKRAQEFRGLVQEALGSRARHRATEIQSTEKMLEQMRAQRASGQKPARNTEQVALTANPQVQDQLRRMMSAHFDKWVDTKIPALDGLTPIEAIRTPAGKEKVAALVLDAERHARKMEPPVDEAVLARLRDRLGLAAPDSI